MQIPSNLLLNKIGKPALYLPTCVSQYPKPLKNPRAAQGPETTLTTKAMLTHFKMIVWGIISTVTAEAKNFGGLLAIRFFLGFVEAAYFVRNTKSSNIDGGPHRLTAYTARMPLLPELLVHQAGVG